jgi:hypothetical protein
MHGAWNVVRRLFFRSAPRSLWAVVSFAPQNFPLSAVEQSVNRLKQCCERLGEYLDHFWSLVTDVRYQEWVSPLFVALAVLLLNCFKPLKSPVAKLHLLLVAWREYVFPSRGIRRLIEYCAGLGRCVIAVRWENKPVGS